MPDVFQRARRRDIMSSLVFRSWEPFTQEEFARWVGSVPVDDLHHYELLEGFIVREPPAGWPHGEIEVEIGYRLARFVKTHGAGRTFGSSQGFDLPSGDTVEPDVAFVSNERWNASKPVLGSFLRVVPDLVFEILSPSTQSIDRNQKKRIYERNGVREYVLVDPKSRVLECFWLQSGKFARHDTIDEEGEFASRALPGLVILVGDLFADI